MTHDYSSAPAGVAPSLDLPSGRSAHFPTHPNAPIEGADLRRNAPTSAQKRSHPFSPRLAWVFALAAVACALGAPPLLGYLELELLIPLVGLGLVELPCLLGLEVRA